ncbi:MAG: CHC2 zinc finger domain-containing protein [Methylovulum sp.]|nr:CHC2 zinc finger domain-containing protein [Methylovulum sp.]
MSNNSEKSDADWIDFKDIKAKTEVHPVLEHFGLLKYLEPHGAELVGWCPIGKEHGKADSFAFNVEKRSFQCFACKSRGSVLDFIAKYQGVNLREAAKIVLDIFGEGKTTTETGRDDRQPEKGRPYGKPNQSPRPKTKNPEMRQETKPSDSKKSTGKSLFLTFAHAEFLVQTHRLDPSRLVVLDTDALETFMKATTKKDKEDSA